MYVRPKKHLGQHFLTDLSVARRIADSLKADRCRSVLEVGCGTGMLTQFLLERTDITLYGAEVDGESIGFLHSRFPDWCHSVRPVPAGTRARRWHGLFADRSGSVCGSLHC